MIKEWKETEAKKRKMYEGNVCKQEDKQTEN